MPKPSNDINGSLGDDEQSLWNAYAHDRSEHYRQELIAFHQVFCNSIARSIYYQRQASDVSLEDCQQLATVGMIEAIDRFDPQRGVPFKAFARWHIEGAVQRGIGAYSDERRLESVKYELRRQRATHFDEGDGFDALVEWTLNMAVGLFLEDVTEDEGVASPAAGYYESPESSLLRVQLKRLAGRLPERQRLIVSQHYFEGIPFVVIAHELELTPARVSQLHRQAMQQLRQWLKSPGLDERI